MANYCFNRLRLDGNPEQLQKLYDKLTQNEEQGLNLDNYDTIFESSEEVEDWGSKWSQFDYIDYTFEDDLMFIGGNSAWNPAIGFWEKVSKHYELDIELIYSEPGNNFAGRVYFQKGIIDCHDRWTYYEFMYDEDNDYFWEEIESLCESSTLDEIQTSLGGLWKYLTDQEKSRIAEIQAERFVN